MSQNNESPAVGEVPPEPALCYSKPKWDDSLKVWRAEGTNGYDVFPLLWIGEKWVSDNKEGQELLRVSAQNTALRALVGELAKQLSEQVNSTNTLAFWGKTNADDVRRYLPHVANDMLRQSNDAIDEMERSAALIAKAKEAGL